MNNKFEKTTHSRVIGGMQMFSGLSVLRGFVSGPVYRIIASDKSAICDTPIQHCEIEKELARLNQAFSVVHDQITGLIDSLKTQIHESAALVFEGHLMMLDDPAFRSSCAEMIEKECYTAERAVLAVADKYALIFSRMRDDYLKERVSDINDIAKRLVHSLQGVADIQLGNLHVPVIVVADELSPAEIIGFPKGIVIGIATDRGSTTSHVALLCRALGIPAVTGMGNLSHVVRDGDFLLLDGARGKIFLHPDKHQQETFVRMAEQSKNLEETLLQYRQKPGRLADGRTLPIQANADHSTTVEELTSVGAEGIGLFRSEYFWLSMDREPSEDEQAVAYAVFSGDQFSGRTVTIRAFDLGGDKLSPGMSPSLLKETNPFLGNRSIRYLLQNPEMFRIHMRAILRASVTGNVRVMFPMIATLEEWREARQMVEQCKSELHAEGIPFNDKIVCGTMIEIPAAALIAEELAAEVEFFSIGTNDLVQYTLAVDRLNESVARLYQPTHPGVLKLIDMTVRAGHEKGIHVAVCGEMASDPVLAVLLVGYGVDELSMSPSQIPLIRRILSQVTMEDAETIVQQVRQMHGQTAEQVYQFCWNAVLKKVPDLMFL